jgi:hypothetical protein
MGIIVLYKEKGSKIDTYYYSKKTKLDHLFLSVSSGFPDTFIVCSIFNYNSHVLYSICMYQIFSLRTKNLLVYIRIPANSFQ